MVTWKTAGRKGLDRRGRGREDEEPCPAEWGAGLREWCGGVGVPRDLRQPGSLRNFTEGDVFFGEDEKTVKQQICCVSSNAKEWVKHGQRGLNRREESG